MDYNPVMNERHEMKYIAKNSGINIFFGILNKLLTFIWVILFTRLFSESDVGLFYWAFAVISIVSSISLFGLDKGILKLNSVFSAGKYFGKSRKLLIDSVEISSVLPVIFIIFSAVFLRKKEPLLFLFSFYLLPVSALRMLQSYIWSLGDMLFYNVSLIAETAIHFLVVLALVFKCGVWLAVAVYIFSASACALISLALIWKRNPEIFTAKNEEYGRKDLLSVSIPLFFSAIIFMTLTNVDTFMIGLLKPDELEQVAYYRIAVRAAFFILLPSQMVLRAIAPTVARKDLKEDPGHGTYDSSQILIVYLSAPVFFVFAAFPEAVAALFGKNYAVFSKDIISILAAGLVLNVLLGASAQILSYGEKQRLYLYITMFILFLNIILNYFLIRAYGASGAAVATAISYTLGTVVCSFSVHRSYRIIPMKPRALIDLTVLFALGIGTRALFAGNGYLPLLLGSVLFCIAEILYIFLFKKDSAEHFVLIKTFNFLFRPGKINK